MCSLPDCSTAYYCSVPYLIYDVILFCSAHHRHQPGPSLLCSTTTTRPPKRHFLSFCSVQWSWFLFAFFFGDSFFTLCGLTCSICLPFAAFGLWTEEWWGYVMHTHNLFSFPFFCVQKRNFVLLFWERECGVKCYRQGMILCPVSIYSWGGQSRDCYQIYIRLKGLDYTVPFSFRGPELQLLAHETKRNEAFFILSFGFSGPAAPRTQIWKETLVVSRGNRFPPLSAGKFFVSFEL